MEIAILQSLSGSTHLTEIHYGDYIMEFTMKQKDMYVYLINAGDIFFIFLPPLMEEVSEILAFANVALLALTSDTGRSLVQFLGT